MPEYRLIPGHPGYRVGDDGTVWSNKRGGEWRQLRPVRNTRGYPFVSLYNMGRSVQETVHRLVLLAFVGPCPEGMECAHDNGNRSDPRLSNLAWKTHVDNMADKIRHGTNSRCLTAETVKDILGHLGELKLSQAEIAAKYGLNESVVVGIAQGKTWKRVTGGRINNRPRVLRRGERSPHAKVTEADVVAIREAFSAGVRPIALARQYGLSRPVVTYIVRGKTWKHAGGPITTAPQKMGRPRKQALTSLASSS